MLFHSSQPNESKSSYSWLFIHDILNFQTLHEKNPGMEKIVGTVLNVYSRTMDLAEMLMEKLTIPYDDSEEKDKMDRISKRKGNFQVQSLRKLSIVRNENISGTKVDIANFFPFQP